MPEESEKWTTDHCLQVLVYGINNPRRKQLISKINEYSSTCSLSDIPKNIKLLDYLTTLIDGPDNCNLVQSFRESLFEDGLKVFSILVEMMMEEIGYDQDDSELLRITRLLQSIPKYGSIQEFPDDYKTGLIMILENAHQESLRDLISQAGYLLSVHFPEERVDRENWNPIARMSIVRGVLINCEGLNFFQMFSQSNGMELHYSIQSIHLVLSRIFKKSNLRLSARDGTPIVEMCLFRWEHPWQMVSSNCRSLFSYVCEIGSQELITEIIAQLNRLEKQSKKRFNALHGLVSHGHLSCDESLLSEILDSVHLASPSLAAACQLLEEILILSPQNLHNDIYGLLTTRIQEGSVDLEYLLASVGKASKQVRKSPTPLEKLVEKIESQDIEIRERFVQYCLISNMGSLVNVLNGALVQVGHVVLLSIRELEACIVSADSTRVTAAIVIVSRLIHSGKVAGSEEWWGLLHGFFNDGGVSVVGCCNDDRSVLLTEFKRFFEKKISNQESLFEIILSHATQYGSLLEESQLPIEIIASMSRLEEFVFDKEGFAQKIFDRGLTSRWRNVRIASRAIIFKIGRTEFIEKNFNQIMNSQNIINDEMAAVISDYVVSAQPLLDRPISDPNINAMTCLAMRNRTTEGFGELMPYLVSVLIFHSQFVGEDSLDTAIAVAASILSPFQVRFLQSNRYGGKVDCRGHPILQTDEASTALAIKAWTSSKAAALCLKSIIPDDSDELELSVLSQVVAVLLLSVKHPAEIGPLETLFAFLLTKMSSNAIEEELLNPLLGCITNYSTTFTLPAALRRSQGLGPLISSIIKSSSMVVMKGVSERLLSIINSSNSEDESTLHALNILRCIVRDSTIADQTIEPFVADILVAAIDILFRLSDEFWRVRSCSTQLFVQAARRLIGTDNEEDWFNGKTNSKKIVSFSEFFFNRGGKNILREFVNVVQNKDDEYVMVPVLSVLQSLSRLAEIENSDVDGKRLAKNILDAVTSKSVHVRRLAAKIIVRRSIECEAELPLAAIDHHGSMNSVHGKLLMIEYWLRAGGDSTLDLEWVKKVWNLKNLPEIVCNTILSISTRGNIHLPISSDERIDKFIDTLDEVKCVENAKVGQMVFNRSMARRGEMNAFYQELLIAILTKYPEFLSEEHFEYCFSVFKGNNLGFARLVEFISLEKFQSVIESWIENELDVMTENLHDDVKIVLAKSTFVRSHYPNIHLLLLLDESPEVRLAASVDGTNSIIGMRSVMEKCSDNDLISLIKEPLNFSQNSTTKLFDSELIIDFSIRKQPRDLATEIMLKRGYREASPVEEVAGVLNHQTFSRFHSIELLQRLRN